MAAGLKAAAQAPAPPEAAETPDPPIWQIAVRELCAFAAKTGDLDLRFTPAPTAAEGIAGHQTVAGRRGAGYQAEVPLQARVGGLLVRGRADGVDHRGRPGQVCVEEVKTHKGDLALQPANHRALHWAQAKVYGALLCRADGLQGTDRLTVALVYLDVRTQRETRLSEDCTADALQHFFEGLCARFIGWAQAQRAHRQARDAGLHTLGFVYPTMRPGQRQLAEHSWHAARTGRCLMAQAPTGIGKTLGTLFPLLKAAGAGAGASAAAEADAGSGSGSGSGTNADAVSGPSASAGIDKETGKAKGGRASADAGLDKLYFLSAKGTGRALALDALGQLRRHAPTLPLRVLELVARDTACVHPDRACHGESCPLAQGFYDRLPAAREAAAALATHAPLDTATLRDTAAQHTVCPYYLAQEMVRWADVVVGDVNYFFDLSALLHGLQQANGWRVALLVDEAHNLPDRARAMYSARLDQIALRGLRTVLPKALLPPHRRLGKAWQALNRGPSPAEGEAAQPTPDASSDTPSAADGPDTLAYRVLPDLPSDWLKALQDFNQAIGEHLAELQLPGRASEARTPDPALMAWYFDGLLFARLAESFGAHSMADLSPIGGGQRGTSGVSRPGRAAGARPRAPHSALAIRNLLPAPFLASRFEAAHCSVLFSATLAPAQFHADLLGLPASTAWLDVAAPFSPEQLAVHLVPQVSTRWAARQRSLAPIAELIAQQYCAEPGNYLAFFSSHDYLAQALDAFTTRYQDIPHWAQARQMDDAARQAFVARFTPEGRGIGFAVLGGAFGEGLDLPGKRLIGAFIATLGLPQFNPVNEAMRQRLDAAFGAGYDYTYLYPGLRKVVQAAGRVIRSPEDRGTVYLIDDRFMRPEVRALLPAWWRPRRWAGPTSGQG